MSRGRYRIWKTSKSNLTKNKHALGVGTGNPPLNLSIMRAGAYYAYPLTTSRSFLSIGDTNTGSTLPENSTVCVETLQAILLSITDKVPATKELLDTLSKTDYFC